MPQHPNCLACAGQFFCGEAVFVGAFKVNGPLINGDKDEKMMMGSITIL